ncbi:MAG: RNA methyltransferase, partial [Oscillospiraceae bacterium]|nr:RNA methyltransferase [Oscillospiraceae bacterium]
AQKLASTQNPQGVFGTFKSLNAQPHAQPMPEHSQAAKPHHRWAALENVQDPGNLGAIARTAEALGIDGLVVFGGCDTYHPKALRASMGALLRLPVAQTDDLPAWLRRTPLPCYAAVPDASAQPAVRVDFSQGGVVVIGNEGIGLSDEAIAACDSRVTIPMPGRAESLNAAAAATILLWEMVRCDR